MVILKRSAKKMDILENIQKARENHTVLSMHANTKSADFAQGVKLVSMSDDIKEREIYDNSQTRTSDGRG